MENLESQRQFELSLAVEVACTLVSEETTLPLLENSVIISPG